MVVVTPVILYLPQIYAKETAVTLATLGTVLLVSRIFDGVTDQLVGYLSDITESRLGSRKPWMLAGTAVILVAGYFLLNPPATAGFSYLLLSMLGFYLGWTMVSVPHTAWGAELSGEYRERARIASFRGVFNNVGSLSFTVLPIVLFALGVAATSEFTLQVLSYAYAFAALALPVSVILACLAAPVGTPTGQCRPSLRRLMLSLRVNKPFWNYFGIFFLHGVANGMLYTVAFTFHDSYLKIGQWFPYIAAAYVGAVTASVPLWLRLSYRLERHRSWAISWMIHVVVMQGFWFLNPGPDAVWGAAAVMLAIALSAGANLVCAPAMLADIVDYGTWKTGAEQTGNYFAFQLMGVKIVQAIGGGLGFYLLAFWGFEVRPDAVNDQRAVVGLLSTYIGVPSVLFAVSIVLMWNFPLTARRHAIIRRRIESRGRFPPRA